VNVAIALAAEGERVCLVDLDLGFGDVAITLQIFPARTIADTVYVQQSLDIETLESLLTPHRENLYALVAPVQPDAKDSIPPALVGTILHLLKTTFDFVIVDTAPAFDEHVLQAFDETDEILLVTTLDVPTLKNVKMAIETLDLLNFPKSKRRLILNRADDKVGLTHDKVEATLKMKITQAIPTSPQVASSTNAGEPIMASLPKHAVSQAITKLANELSRSAQSNPTPSEGKGKEHPATSGRRGLLRRNGR
jgi:pilus assembly protein CpaE